MVSNHAFESAMRHALNLALNGPAHGVNPQVGAVILNPEGEMVAEGWHMGSGTPHAEIIAMENAREKLGFQNEFPEGYTAVVTLEPCNHTGKTGPCSQALLDAGISRVVYASNDPGEKSSGGGKFLKKQGVEIIKGLLKSEADDQARHWIVSTKKQRPFVTIKYASTLDGRGAAQDGSSQWISGPESRADSHRRRSELDAILVGTGTAIIDDPELTARRPDGSYFEHQPLRVVVGERELDKNLRIFNDRAETLVITTQSLQEAMTELWDRGIRHVLVEGGPNVASKFVKQGLADEFLVYLAPMLLGGDKTALKDLGINNISEAIDLEIKELKTLGKDVFIRASRSK